MKGEHIYAVHVVSDTNVGDANSSPLTYFARLSLSFTVRTISIADIELLTVIPEGSAVILGGGGLLANKPRWDSAMRVLTDRTDRVIAWGIGLNRPPAAALGDLNLPDFTSRFALLGLRDSVDAAEGVPWVPCSSCMSHLLDVRVHTRRDVGVVIHGDHVGRVPEEVLRIGLRNGLMSNFIGKAGMPALLDYIGSSEKLVTNSYHALYWAILMGKPAVIFGAFSEKFWRFPWKVPMIEHSDELPMALESALPHPAALAEARTANLEFSRRVEAMLCTT